MLSPTTTLPTPTTPSDWNNIQFRLDGALVDRRPDLARLSFANTDKPVTITHGNNRSEPRPLPRVCLLLDEPDSQNLLLNIRQERVDDLRLFDPQSLCEDLFHRYDLSLLDLSAQLSLRHPSNLLTGTLAHRATSTGVIETVFLSSREEAEALTISPLRVASVICTVTYLLVRRTTARGLPDFTSARRSL